MKTAPCNFLIVGAGIIGLSIARELIKQGHENILIIEKESLLAQHASGRNSGVLHAGIYYKADSLKAKFCLKGNYAMQDYCREHNLPLKLSGKVIVTRDASELEILDELYQRAQANGATVSLIDKKQLNDIEPYANTTERALYSPHTAVVDPKKIMQSLYDELLATQKITIQFNTCFVGRKLQTAITNQGNINYNYLINAAGSYADKVAHHFGLAKNFILIPFKGTYRKLDPAHSYLVNGNIYPVPNIENPFLGVHFTKDIHGTIYVGPTAIPAFGRENYHLLKDIDKEAARIFLQDIILIFQNKKFRNNAFVEPKKYIAKYFYRDAKKLIKALDPAWLKLTTKVGIRPQLVNWQTKELVMDFMLEQEEHSLHILNAISPAFTSSFSFANYLVDSFIAPACE